MDFIYLNNDLIDELICDNKQPLICYFHTQRTGGTRLKKELKSLIGAPFVYTAQTISREDYKAWRQLDEVDLVGFRAYAGHSDFELKNWRRPLFNIATIRKPIYRMISLYHYCKSQPSHRLFELASTCDIREFYLRAIKIMPHYIKNVQIKRLTGSHDLCLAKQIISNNYAAISTTNSLNLLVEQVVKFSCLSNKPHIEQAKADESRYQHLVDIIEDISDDYNNLDNEMYDWISSISCR